MLHSLNALPSSNFNPALNYLCEANPFGLTSPPTWFLEEMWKYDPCLVIFPSKEEAVYRLARRVEHGAPLLTVMQKRPDTSMFWKHRLVPVTSIMPSPFVHWSPLLLKDLAERDIRRQGGYKKVAAAMDAADAEAEHRWVVGVEDGATIRARASWREQKWSRGEALDLGARKPEGARTSKDRKHFGPSTRTRRPLGGDGLTSALFTGRDTTSQGARPFLDADADMRTLIVRAG